MARCAVTLCVLAALSCGKPLIRGDFLGPGDTGRSDSTTTGDTRVGDALAGDHRSGEVAPGDQTRGDVSTGDPASSDVASGDWISGDADRGDTNSGDTRRGDANDGDANLGDANAGDNNAGDAALIGCRRQTHCMGAEVCRYRTCTTAVPCPHECNAWFPMGASELVPWSQQLQFDSMTGVGIMNPIIGRPERLTMAIGDDDRAWVGWQNQFGGWHAFVRYWDGTDWTGIGGSDTTGMVGIDVDADGEPAIAVDSMNRPVIAWTSRLGPQRQYAIAVRRLEGTTWQELDGSASGTGLADALFDTSPWYNPFGGLNSTPAPRIVIDSLDRPVVYWSELRPMSVQIMVERFDGMTWEELAGPSTWGLLAIAGLQFGQGNVTVGQNDEPIIAWAEESTSWRVQLARHDGMGWGGLDGGAMITEPPATRSAWAPSVHGSPAGPVDVFYRGPGLMSDQAFGLRYAAGAWTELGGSNTGDGVSGGAMSGFGGVSSFAATHDSMSNPQLLVRVGVFQPEAMVRAWNGTSWETLGGTTAIFDEPVFPHAIALDRLDQTVVAAATLDRIFVARFDGMGWSGFGGPNPTGALSGEPFLGGTLELDSNGLPRLAFHESPVTGTQWARALEYDGMAWVESGAESAPSTFAAENPWTTSVILDRAGLPWVVWVSFPTPPVVNSRNVFVERFDGTDWIAVGNSTTPGALNTPGQPTEPSIALDANELPAVAWHETDMAGNDYIYLSRFDGVSWSGLGGSDTGTGLDGVAGQVWTPAVTFDANDHPTVAFGVAHDPGSGTLDRFVAVNRWNGTSWDRLGWSESTGGLLRTPTGAPYGYDLAYDRNGDLVLSTHANWPGSVGVHVTRWRNDQWTAFGTGPAIPGAGVAWQGPGLSFDNTDRPLVGGTVAGEAIVRRWTGSEWIPLLMPPGAAASNSRPPDTEFIDLAADGEKACVAWHEPAGGGFVQLRCAFLP